MNIHSHNFLSIIFLFASLLLNGAFADVPHSFIAGEPAIAAEVNENFASLDQRISQLEQSNIDIVAVDCSANVNALATTEFDNSTTYVLSGMCNGPIVLNNVTNIKIMGDSIGSKDDGIQLPADLTEHPGAALGIFGPNRLSLENLTISAENYVSESYPFGNTVSTVKVANGAVLTMNSMDILGGDIGVFSLQNGTVVINEEVIVIGFNKYGLIATNSAAITTQNPITVTGLATATGTSVNEAVLSARGSNILINDGGTFSSGSGSSVTTNVSLGAYDNGSIRIRSDGTTILNGLLQSARSASIRVDAGTLNGNILAFGASMIRLGNTDVNSSLISVNKMSAADFRGTTDLGSTDIFCQNANMQIFIEGSVTHSGTICP